MNRASIGIFDSGFGGLTVWKALSSLLPHENLSYFADTLHLPYGNKTQEEIIKYSFQSIETLASKGIKLLVVACHTSCLNALPFLEKRFPFPIVGIASSGIEELLFLKKADHLAFLATHASVASGVYQKKIQEKFPFAKVTGIACPLFVPLVENGHTNHPILTKQAVKEDLRHLKDLPLDAVLLGCTHYPLLKNSIQEELGSHIQLIDPSMACAAQVQKILQKNHLETDNTQFPLYEFYVTANPVKFQTVGKLFLPSLSYPTLCSVTPSFA